MAKHLNGSGHEPERKTNITSLEEVRKRAEAETKQAARVKRGVTSPRDLIIGAVIIAMALGMLWHWLAPLFERCRDGTMITLGHYLTVGACLFTLGIFGIFLNRKNVIVILMSIELMLLAVNINLVAFSAHLGDLTGQVFALMILTVAAAEAAIGLAIVVVYYRNRGSIAVEDINMMKG